MGNVNESGNDLTKLKSMFADFQKKQTESSSKGGSRQNILAKYFVPRAQKEVFRILPPKDGRKHIEEAFFHEVTTNISGGKIRHGTKLYCPAHNDPFVPKLGSDGKPLLDEKGAPMLVPAPCPLCDKYRKLLATQDPSTKGIKKEKMNDLQKAVHAKNTEIYREAIKWEAKRYYIVRGIDKGQEKDGVKFWRFKHNYKNQGTLDKLLPILQLYMDDHQADFSSPVDGTDINIIMTDSEFNGFVYKAISAITAKGKSPLHSDKHMAQAWLDDDIIWRDVFKPKSAPNITPYEYLELVASGNSPYWDDTDQANKRWVFPGRPDLQERANTRTMDLDSPSREIEQASDLNLLKPRVTISNITEDNVGKYEDDAVDLGKETLATTVKEETKSTVSQPTNDNNYEESDDYDEPDDYDDLPF